MVPYFPSHLPHLVSFDYLFELFIMDFNAPQITFQSTIKDKLSICSSEEVIIGLSICMAHLLEKYVQVTQGVFSELLFMS